MSLSLNFDRKFAPAFAAPVFNRHPIVTLIVANLGKLATTRLYDAAFEIEAERPLLGIMIVLIVHASETLSVDLEGKSHHQ